jgi:hypothetical protein
MRAAADDAEILSKLIRITKYFVPTTSTVETVLTADVDIDDIELPFLKTGFTTGAWVLVGSGTNQALIQLGTVPADSSPIPVEMPAPFAWPTGTRVALCTAVDLGYIEEGSASLSGSSSTPSVGAANANGKIWQGDPDVGDLGISWGQRASSMEVLADAYGFDETLVKGDGTAGDPRRLLVHPDVLGTMRDYAFVLSGLKKNGVTMNMGIFNPTPTLNVNTAFGAKAQPAVWTVGCLYTHMMFWELD